MSINRKLIIALAVGSIFGISSCKKYLDVNKNPNVAQTATVQTLLPAAQLTVGTALGVDLEIDGSFWAQYWTQNPGASQYHNLDQYAPGQDGFTFPWTNLYAANENFYQLYQLALSQKKKQYMAISLLMQAYTFQLITDGWGDVPFSQALKGQYIDGHIVNPKYDSQMAVYNGIIALIDTANTLINPSDAILPGADDLIYGGNMTEWQKFSNTLMLRVLLRMSKVNPTAAAAAVTALYATGPTFIGVGDDAAISYGSSSTNRNPLYAEEGGLGGVQNLMGSATCIDSMNNNVDLRAFVFYEYLPSTGTVVGLQQGLYNIAYSAGTLSIPNIYVAGDAAGNSGSANAPVIFMSSWESLFLQAEAAAEGWGAAGTDSALFYAAIRANFDYPLYNTAMNTIWGFSGDSACNIYLTSGGYWTTYPTAPGTTPEQKLRFIVTQKWFAMCGNQGFEAWSEWRRTGYPDFLQISVSSIIGSKFPKRFYYPTSESTTNSKYPGLAPITKNVWWDVL